MTRKKILKFMQMSSSSSLNNIVLYSAAAESYKPIVLEKQKIIEDAGVFGFYCFYHSADAIDHSKQIGWVKGG